MEDPAVTARLDQIEALLADVQQELARVGDLLGLEVKDSRRREQDMSWLGWQE